MLQETQAHGPEKVLKNNCSLTVSCLCCQLSSGLRSGEGRAWPASHSQLTWFSDTAPGFEQ